jgi:putative intracellular protease/amidase
LNARAYVRAGVAVLIVGSAAVAAAATDADCVRSEPAPLFAAATPHVRDHTFRVRSSHEAVEQFRLDGGVEVIVEHGGCEYVVATLRFRGPAVSDGNPYATTARLLRTLQREGPQIPFQLDAAVRTLDELARRRPQPALGSEHAVAGDGEAPLQAAIRLDRADRDRKPGSVQVTLFRGPL